MFRDIFIGLYIDFFYFAIGRVKDDTSLFGWKEYKNNFDNPNITKNRLR